MIPQQRGVDDVLASFGDLSDIEFLTVAEVAGVLRVSKMTVYRMVHSGEMEAVRVGRSFRVRAKTVREYLAGASYQAN